MDTEQTSEQRDVRPTDGAQQLHATNTATAGTKSYIHPPELQQLATDDTATNYITSTTQGSANS